MRMSSYPDLTGDMEDDGDPTARADSVMKDLYDTIIKR